MITEYTWRCMEQGDWAPLRTIAGFLCLCALFALIIMTPQNPTRCVQPSMSNHRSCSRNCVSRKKSFLCYVEESWEQLQLAGSVPFWDLLPSPPGPIQWPHSRMLRGLKSIYRTCSEKDFFLFFYLRCSLAGSGCVWCGRVIGNLWKTSLMRHQKGFNLCEFSLQVV